MTHREMNAFVRRLRRDGFTASVTGRTHWRISHPDLESPVFAAGTPSDRRALHNLRATIRRNLISQPTYRN
jgi:hypothetical protein